MKKKNRVYESYQPSGIDFSGIDAPKPPFILGPDGKPMIMVGVSETLAFQPEHGFDPPKPTFVRKDADKPEL